MDYKPGDWEEAGQRDWGLGAAFSVFVKSQVVKTWNSWRKMVHFGISSLGLIVCTAFQEAIQKASIDSHFFSIFINYFKNISKERVVILNGREL